MVAHLQAKEVIFGRVIVEADSGECLRADVIDESSNGLILAVGNPGYLSPGVGVVVHFAEEAFRATVISIRWQENDRFLIGLEWEDATAAAPVSPAVQLNS